MPRPRMEDLRGKRVLVTGAASGIGRATAKAVAGEGAQLYLTDIDLQALDSTAAEISGNGGNVAFHAAADLADYNQVADLASSVHARVPALDVVMNVAGISAWGTVETLEHRQWKAQVDVNLMGPIHVIESFLPPMIAAGGGGYLVNVSSAAGLIGLPWHAAYSASKFGLRGVSEVLRFDLRRHHIGVSLVCPGAVATPLADSIEIAGVDKSTARFRRLQTAFLRHAVSPERAAAAIIEAVHKGRYLVFTSGDIQLVYLLQRYCPPVYDLVMMTMNSIASRALGRSN